MDPNCSITITATMNETDVFWKRDKGKVRLGVGGLVYNILFLRETSPLVHGQAGIGRLITGFCRPIV